VTLTANPLRRRVDLLLAAVVLALALLVLGGPLSALAPAICPLVLMLNSELRLVQTPHPVTVERRWMWRTIWRNCMPWENIESVEDGTAPFWPPLEFHVSDGTHSAWRLGTIDDHRAVAEWLNAKRLERANSGIAVKSDDLERLDLVRARGLLVREGGVDGAQG